MKLKNRRSIILVFCITLLGAFTMPDHSIRIWLIGDSTVCIQPKDRSPVTGWGTPFEDFWDSTVTVNNRAKGGRSTRTFISEGRWKNVSDSLREGDYVFIQFGHNDEAKEPQYRERYTPVPDYINNLIMIIKETREKNAFPVLVTPVTRLVFDSAGHIRETHKEYSAAVREVGASYHVPVVDLDERSREMVQKLGPEVSRMLYLQLDTLEHPHYPVGRNDNTHFNEYGARRMAEIVLKEIRVLNLDLVNRITKKAAP